jgi:xanthine dehydrogenase YagT iron-sulfur-binding subunit
MSESHDPVFNSQEHTRQVFQSIRSSTSLTRREFIGRVTIASTGVLLANGLANNSLADSGMGRGTAAVSERISIAFTLNGQEMDLGIDPRTTLLDMLRENLSLNGTKKGCDHGQCGACTVLVNDRRVNSCLLLAATCQKARVTTIEGLAKGDQLHPVQAAFIKHDAFQCGYCTPGQICSVVGLLKEGRAKGDASIRELMSGNICRCGAYQNILDAIKEAQTTAI